MPQADKHPLPNPLLSRAMGTDRAAIVQKMQEDRAANTELGDEEEADDAELPEDQEDGEDVSEGEETADEGEENEADEDEVEDTDEDDEEDSDGGDEEPVSFDDDDLVEVKVDGKLQKVPFKEVAAALSGREAIKTRLNEATILRGAAHELFETRRVRMEEVEAGVAAAVAAVKAMIFTPTIPKPDVNLATSNPKGYALAVQAYENEQASLAARRKQVADALAEIEKHKTEAMTAFEKEQQQLLVQQMPELKEKDKAKEFATTLHQIGGHYGFTTSEIANVRDVRLLLMARDAAKLRAYEEANGPLDTTQIGGKKKVKLVADNSEKRGRKPKVLRSASNVAARKSSLKQKAGDVAAARKAAQEAPTRGNIAAMIAANRAKRGQ